MRDGLLDALTDLGMAAPMGLDEAAGEILAHPSFRRGLAGMLRVYVGPRDRNGETWYIDIDSSETDAELLDLANELADLGMKGK